MNKLCLKIFLYTESDLSESIYYASLYGRLPLPMKNPNTFHGQDRPVAYVGQLDQIILIKSIY